MESVVKHTPNTYYLELRQDYITLCQSLTYRKSQKSKSSPYCKSLILAVMEKWTNEKIRKKKDPHIHMTYAQWTEEMYGMFGRWVILDSLDELTEEQLIIREKCRINGRESYKYLLNVACLNKKLAELQRLQIDATDGNVDATDLQVDATDLEIDGTSSSPASKSRHFIESVTKNQSIESKSTYASEQPSLSSENGGMTPEGQLISQNLYPGRKSHKQQEIEHFNELAEIMEANRKKPGDLTLVMVQDVWEWAMQAKPYLRKDPSWKLKNIVNELPFYFANQPVFTEPTTQVIDAAQEPIHRETEPLPRRLCKWMDRTAREFGEDAVEWTNELEWFFQHTTCSEEEFYTTLLQSYTIACEYPEDQRMQVLFTEFKQSLSLIIESEGVHYAHSR